jgi:sortase A
MTHYESIRFVVLHSLGNFLVLFSIYGVLATFGPAVYYELQYRVIEARGIHFVVSSQSSASMPKDQVVSSPPVSRVVPTEKPPDSRLEYLLSAKKEQILIPKDTEFGIVIPKIGASAKVYPNVDPGNPREFLPVLQEGIAHAKGSVFPGMQGNIYLFAHSTDNWWNVGRYNALFYLLKDLQVGDEIVIFFETVRYDYVVTQAFIADPSDLTFLSHDQKGAERLVLQTCWPPGTTWKRYYVIAQPKSTLNQK